MKRPAHWKALMRKASRVDYGEPLPQITEEFFTVWASHYARIATMTPPKPSLLEIGAGYGVLASGLAQMAGGSVWTTEHPSRGYLYRPSFRDFLSAHGVCLVANDLKEGLPFGTGKIRQVFCCDVIEHLPAEQMGRLVEEIFRVLAPGGELILSTPNLNRFSNLVRFLSNHTVNPPITVSKVGDTYGHVREMAPKELVNLLWSRGLSTEALVYGLIPYFTFQAVEGSKPVSSKAGDFINTLTRLLYRFRSSFGDEIYLLARRMS